MNVTGAGSAVMLPSPWPPHRRADTKRLAGADQIRPDQTRPAPFFFCFYVRPSHPARLPASAAAACPSHPVLGTVIWWSRLGGPTPTAWSCFVSRVRVLST